jgi:hypothetical protein
MDYFTDNINVKNKSNFSSMFYSLYLSYLRKEIFEHMIKYVDDENNYFDIGSWCKKNINQDETILDQMIKTIIKELEDKGWNCKLSYGGTALFIYSSEKPPHSCFEDGF